MSINWRSDHVGYNGDHIYIEVAVSYWEDPQTFSKELDDTLSKAADQARALYVELNLSDG